MNPSKRLLTQGMVGSITYKNPQTAITWPRPMWAIPADPAIRFVSEAARHLLREMSKSKSNGVRISRGDHRYGVDHRPDVSSCSRRTGKRSGVG